jgi:23S rRNA (guanosine2251-2'-O)-methyltransferase
VRVVNLGRAIEALRSLGYLTVSLEGDVDLALSDALDAKRPTALVLGAEGKGVRPGVSEACEKRARIPIAPAMESLNVSAAAAIALYEAARKR